MRLRSPHGPATPWPQREGTVEMTGSGVLPADRRLVLVQSSRLSWVQVSQVLSGRTRVSRMATCALRSDVASTLVRS